MSVKVYYAGDTGQTGLTCDIYYDVDGTTTEREADIALTEEPASSGVYAGDAAVLLNGDLVVVRDSDGNFLGSGEYQPETNTILIEDSDATNQINAACDTAVSDAALATAASLATTDGKVDDIKTLTDNLPADTSAELDAVDSALDTIDTVVDAIKVKTDSMASGGGMPQILD